MSDLHVVILAAGKGTRMKSALPKVLHRAGELPLIDHVLRDGGALHPPPQSLRCRPPGRGRRASARETAGPAVCIAGAAARHRPRAAAGGAALAGRARNAGAAVGRCAAARGRDTLRRAGRDAPSARAPPRRCSPRRLDDPHGYGRIVREDGRIAAIVEEKDATPDERAIDEINSGIYAFDLAPLFDALRSLGTDNAQGEYYLPDLVRIYRARGRVVETVPLDGSARDPGRQQPKGAGGRDARF